MLETKLCGIALKNPVIAASGTFGFGREFSEFFDIGKLGGICTKGLTLHPRDGNGGNRILETKSGLINSIGLQNPGVARFIQDELPFLKQTGTAVIANLGGSTLEEMAEGAALLEETSVDMIELNISCPNVKKGGMAFGIKAETAKEAVQCVRAATKKPLVVKLSPNAEDIVEMAVSCERAGADALSLVNTFKAMAIDIEKRKPVFENVFAGLSGPAIKPIALRMVYEVSRAVKAPVIGMGGILTGRDAVEFLMAGASAVAVGTANFIRPDQSLVILREMEEFFETQGISSAEEIKGAAFR